MRLLIKHEFKRNLSSLILWGSIIIILSVLILSIYPMFQSSMVDLEEMMNTFPPAFLEVFGFGDNGLNLTNVYGWYGIEGYLLVMLIGGSYAAILGSSIISKEEDDKTIEFLLSKPISRNKILLAKGSIVIINLVILNIALFITNVVGFMIIDEVRIITVLLLMAGPLLLQLVFAAIAMAISVFVTKSRSVLSIALGLVIGLYFLNVVAKLTDKLSYLKYFSPFEYVNAVDIIGSNIIKPIYLLLSILIIFISAFIMWFYYRKKDITV